MAWKIVALAFLWNLAGRDASTFVSAAVSAAVSSLLAEVLLQLLGVVYLGMTVHHARRHGYYCAGRLAHVPRGASARHINIGALLWLVLVSVTVGAAAFTFTPLGRLTADGVRWLAHKAPAYAQVA